MPRYFFHLEGPDGRIEDHEGVVAPSPEQALDECLQVVGELRDEAGSTEDWMGWSLVLVCAETQLTLRIDLHDTIAPHELGRAACDALHRSVQ